MPILRKAAAVLVAVLVSTLTLAVHSAEAAPRIRLNGSGDLIVLGENGSEEITIRPVSSGVWEVVIMSDNGVTVRQEFTRSPRNVTINARGNDDRIIVEDLEDPIRNLTVNVGSGMDYLELTSLDIDGQLKLLGTGSGGNEFDIRNVVVDGRTTISLGTGHHFVTTRDGRFNDNYRLTASTNSRLDLTSIFSAYTGRVDVRTGNQRDLLSWNTQNFFGGPSVRIDTRGGNDDVLLRFDHVSSAPLSVRLGSGDDVMRFAESRFTGRVDVFGQSGDDLVEAVLTNFGTRTRFNAGSGNGDSYVNVNSIFAIGPDLIGFETTS